MNTTHTTCTITLPHKATTNLKRALIAHTHTVHQDTRTETARLHADAGITCNPNLYRRLLISARDHTARTEDRELATNLAHTVCENMAWDANDNGTRLSAPTIAMVSQVAPDANTRTTRFPIFSRYALVGWITFDGDVVTWDVPVGSDSAAAEAGPTAEVFFGFLRGVEWAPGTGGVGRAGDGGGEWVWCSFGPVGEREWAAAAVG